MTATNVALEKLSKQVTGQLIPDQHGSSGDVKFDITGYNKTADLSTGPSQRLDNILIPCYIIIPLHSTVNEYRIYRRLDPLDTLYRLLLNILFEHSLAKD